MFLSKCFPDYKKNWNETISTKWATPLSLFLMIIAVIYRNTRTRRETCSKSTIVNFEQVTAGWDEDGFNDMVLGFYF